MKPAPRVARADRSGRRRGAGTPSLPKGAAEWLRTGERGISSEAIFSHLTGIPVGGLRVDGRRGEVQVKAAKTHIIRGDRSACGLSGRRLRSLTPSAVLPAPIPFVLLKRERQAEIIMATTCKSCINRRWDL